MDTLAAIMLDVAIFDKDAFADHSEGDQEDDSRADSHRYRLMKLEIWHNTFKALRYTCLDSRELGKS